MSDPQWSFAAGESRIFLRPVRSMGLQPQRGPSLSKPYSILEASWDTGDDPPFPMQMPAEELKKVFRNLELDTSSCTAYEVYLVKPKGIKKHDNLQN